MIGNSYKKSKIVNVITFLFLFLVLFFFNSNIIDTHAAGLFIANSGVSAGTSSRSGGSGGGFQQINNHGYTNAVLLQESNTGDATGGKTIYWSSFNVGYVHYGENEVLLKYRLEYEADHGTVYPKLEFLNWLFEVKKIQLGSSIILYPDCVIFNESYKGKPYYCTGWLYLYCDSNRYLEYAENMAGIGNDNIPLYFEEGNENGHMFITFPGEYFYYPVSNMILKSDPDQYLAQIFPAATGDWSYEEIEQKAQYQIELYYNNCLEVHDVDDFSGIYGTKDILIYPNIIPKEYAWVFAFCNSSMIENFTNNIGNSYPHPWPFKETTIKQGINEAVGIAPFLQYYINYGNIKAGAGQSYYGMKESTQTLGIDILFKNAVKNNAASRVGWQKKRIMGWGNLLDCSATIENIFTALKNSTGVGDTETETGNAGTVEGTNGTNGLNAENIEQIFRQAMVPSNIPAGFVNVNGTNVSLRYVWSACAGKLVGDTDLNFGRDAGPDNAYSVSSKIDTYSLSTAKISTLKGNRLTSSFASGGTDSWSNASKDDQVKSMIVVFQTHPELFISIVNNNAATRAALGVSGSKNGAEIIAKLNALGANPSTYQQWKKTLIAAGNCLYSHSLASNTPSNGWNTAYAFLRSGGNYYSLLYIGINICQTEIVAPPGISDLVLSNSYNDLPSNFLYTASTSESTGSSGGSFGSGGFTEIEDEDTPLVGGITTDSKPGFIFVGESHVHKLEEALTLNDIFLENPSTYVSSSINSLSTGNSYLYNFGTNGNGKNGNLFMIHTLSDGFTEPEYGTVGATMQQAFPDWLSKGNGSKNGITTYDGTATAYERIMKIITDNPDIVDWNVIVMQGYNTATSGQASWDSYVSNLNELRSKLSNIKIPVGNGTSRIASCDVYVSSSPHSNTGVWYQNSCYSFGKNVVIPNIQLSSNNGNDVRYNNTMADAFNQYVSVRVPNFINLTNMSNSNSRGEDGDNYLRYDEPGLVSDFCFDNYAHIDVNHYDSSTMYAWAEYLINYIEMSKAATPSLMAVILDENVALNSAVPLMQSPLTQSRNVASTFSLSRSVPSGNTTIPNSSSSSGSSTTNKQVEVNYNPTARNVIDWMHNGPTPDLIMLTNDGKPAFAAHAIGGRSNIPAEITGSGQKNMTTMLDLNSQWKRYDIGCGIVMDCASAVLATSLKKDSNNVLDVQADEKMADAYYDNKERLYYNTFVFVGRIPESDPNIKVNTSDFRVVATAKYNNYKGEEEFDASNHIHQSTQYYMTEQCKDGSAASALNAFFTLATTDYNTKVLFKVYGENDYYYNTTNNLKVAISAQPYAIQKLDKASLANYSAADYAELGPNAKGYSGLTPVVTDPVFKNTNGDVDIEPGDVVAFQLAYFIPNNTTLEAELQKNSLVSEYQKSLYDTGRWYSDYGTILMVDLDFQLLPAIGKEEKWTTIDSNSNNNWARERLNPPLINNMYFTEASVLLDGAPFKGPFTAGELMEGNFLVANAPSSSDRELVIKVSKAELFGTNAGGTDLYFNNNLSLQVKWRFWCKGRSAAKADINTYNYLDWYNGLTLNAGTIKANLTAPINEYQREMNLQGANALTVHLNSDYLNAAKEKSFAVSLPVNDSNQYHDDWEIVTVQVEVPEKDNSVQDLVLVSNGTAYGNIKRSNGDNHSAQVIPAELNNATLYAVVERLAPSIKWKETGKGDIGLKFTMSIDDGKGNTETMGSLVSTSIPGGYMGVSLNQFLYPGNRIIYKTNISGPFSYLSATANYRNFGTYYDREDMNMGNNYWSEIWESAKNPNFVLDIVAGQENVQKSMVVRSNGECPSEPLIVYPWLEFQISQENPNAKGTWNPRVHVNMDGLPPKEVSGIAYMGNGIGTATFSTGDTASRSVYALWDETNLYWGINASENKTFTMRPHINYNCCKTVMEETYYEDNYKEFRWTGSLNCKKEPSPTEPVCCIFDKRINQDAKTFYGSGQSYEWDAQFRWSQQNNNQTEGVNIKPREHDFNCPCVSVYESVENADGSSTSVLVEYREHEHCFCYCSVSHAGPNNGKTYWRSKDLGYGLYTEVFNIHIYVWSSAHGTRDIAGGATKIYSGETFKFWFETEYHSNRDSLPDAKHEPFSQPYTTYQGGQGCHPCNYLSRWPGVYNVDGPRTIDLKISGSQNYDMEKYRIGPQYTVQNGAVHKQYRWVPVPDEIFVPETQIVGQQIKLYICVYDFLGHHQDSSWFAGGSSPGYAWYTRAKQAYCDSKSGIISLAPSKMYISSGQEAEGLDTSSGGSQEGENFVDGDIWVQ